MCSSYGFLNFDHLIWLAYYFRHWTGHKFRNKWANLTRNSSQAFTLDHLDPDNFQLQLWKMWFLPLKALSGSLTGALGRAGRVRPDVKEKEVSGLFFVFFSKKIRLHECPQVPTPIGFSPEKNTHQANVGPSFSWPLFLKLQVETFSSERLCL